MLVPFIYLFERGHRFIYDNKKPLDVPSGVEPVAPAAPVAPSVAPGATRQMAGGIGEDLASKEADERQKYSFEEFIRRFGEAAKDEKSKKEFAEWAAKQTDVEILRRAGVDAMTNSKDVLAKHLKLASEYLNKVEDKDGHIVFEVNFKGNELAEWKIGAGNLLPPVVKTVKIYDNDGKVFEGERKVVNGRVGYYSGGAYLPIHSGYKIEILEIQAVTEEAVSTRIKEENELFEKDGKKLVIKEKLEKFFKDKGLEIKVDDSYFVSGIDELLGELEKVDPEWWQKHLEGKSADGDFVALFAKTFTEEDLNFIANLCRLRDLQKAREDEENVLDDVYMSDFVRLRNDAKFSDFKGKMTDDQLYAFVTKEGVKLGGSYSDVVADSGDVQSKEPFRCIDGKFWLRENAAAAFLKAREYSKTLVPPVELRLSSAHRGIESQKGIYAGALKKYGSAAAARKWAALPGSSPHHTGGAIDVAAIVNGRGGVKHANQKYLKTILPRFGFVNYSAEPWHWEIYTKRWQRITGNSGPLYTARLEKINASNASQIA